MRGQAQYDLLISFKKTSVIFIQGPIRVFESYNVMGVK